LLNHVIIIKVKVLLTQV